MYVIITFTLTLRILPPLALFPGQWGELRFQCPGFHTRLCASLCVCVCVCARTHIATKWVNFHPQVLPMTTHTSSLSLSLTLLLYWSAWSGSLPSRLKWRGKIILGKENNSEPRKWTCSFFDEGIRLTCGTWSTFEGQRSVLLWLLIAGRDPCLTRVRQLFKHTKVECFVFCLICENTNFAEGSSDWITLRGESTQ